MDRTGQTETPHIDEPDDGELECQIDDDVPKRLVLGKLVHPALASELFSPIDENDQQRAICTFFRHIVFAAIDYAPLQFRELGNFNGGRKGEVSALLCEADILERRAKEVRKLSPALTRRQQQWVDTLLEAAMDVSGFPVTIAAILSRPARAASKG